MPPLARDGCPTDGPVEHRLGAREAARGMNPGGMPPTGPNQRPISPLRDMMNLLGRKREPLNFLSARGAQGVPRRAKDCPYSWGEVAPADAREDRASSPDDVECCGYVTAEPQICGPEDPVRDFVPYSNDERRRESLDDLTLVQASYRRKRVVESERADSGGSRCRKGRKNISVSGPRR